MPALDHAADLTAFRRRILEQIPPRYDLLSRTPTYAFAWPTVHCSVGCAHCNFGSLPEGRRAGSAPTLDPASLVPWLVAAGARWLILCGGGEPLDEVEICSDTIARTAGSPLRFGLYTSGTSLAADLDPAALVGQWRRLWRSRAPRDFLLRISLDRFHVERTGAERVAEWLRTVSRLAPDWRVSLRGLRVVGDASFEELARLLGATLVDHGARGTARLVLPDGYQVPVDRKAYVIDGRGSLGLLERRGLRLPDDERRTVQPVSDLVQRTHALGRPLSRRLTVGRTRLDLEIHPDASVHVLEAQASDLRMRYTDAAWTAMREVYFRDPIIHAVALRGLPGVATWITEAIRNGIAGRATVPYSVEQLRDPRVLDWVTAQLVLSLQPEVRYAAGVVAAATEVAHAGTRAPAPAGGRRG